MLASLVAAVIAALAAQSGPADRTRAVELARAGRTAEALTLFERLVAIAPDDVDARLWIARLHARLGQTSRAEGEFRDVLEKHPSDVDARIGLSGVLLRRGAWPEALAMLRETEPYAHENADFFAVLARAYHRAGDDSRALGYYARARALAPDDRDVRYAYEDTAELYSHSIAFEGFGEHVGPSTNAGSGTFTVGIRAQPRLQLDAQARVHQRVGDTDVTAGGGVEWRVSLVDTVHVHAIGGPGNTSLPIADVGGDFTHYAGAFEVGGAFRRLWFDGVGVVAASPVVAWDRGRWRTDARYSYSYSSFNQTGHTSGDSSVMIRETWRPRWRLNVNVAYAYGIESFEDLTTDRLGALGATTFAAGVRIRTPQLAQIFATWEHQWRSNNTAMDRFTVAIVRSFP
ncbi:MAG TPA: tetratricopeptide repeat protein [Vicinamibacterales bacterium]|jgi:Flp pilus assembly protein TadD|nr:tetratricopeptide repeat protein [Vicinamibacterales bacterium]